MLRLVVPRVLGMGEPVMGHELDPERGEHIEERRLAIIAVGVGRTRRALAGVAVGRPRLVAGEEPAADHLRVGLEERDAVAVAVLRRAGRGRARDWSNSKSTFLVKSCPADPIAGFRMSLQMPVVVRKRMRSPWQSCEPSSRDPEEAVGGIVRREPHLRPDLADRAVLGGEVCRVGGVVEEVEADQLHPLVFEVEERAVDAADVAVKKM